MPADRQMLEELRDELRGRFLPYLRRAFQRIPPVTKPRILDIGCGSGVPTIELAHLSGGDVTGVDIDSDSLKRLKKRAKAAGLTGRVHVVRGSMTSMDFPAASYDILWAEGAANVIGFEQALRDWKRFLRPGGYLVLHDSVENLERTKEEVAVQGYQLLDSFTVTSDVWWKEYFEPLGRAMQQVRRENPRDLKLLAALEQVDREVKGCLEHPEENQSVYLVLRLQ